MNRWWVLGLGLQNPSPSQAPLASSSPDRVAISTLHNGRVQRLPFFTFSQAPCACPPYLYHRARRIHPRVVTPQNHYHQQFTVVRLQVYSVNSRRGPTAEGLDPAAQRTSLLSTIRQPRPRPTAIESSTSLSCPSAVRFCTLGNGPFGTMPATKRTRRSVEEEEEDDEEVMETQEASSSLKQDAHVSHLFPMLPGII
jgi:hypothetical protein